MDFTFTPEQDRFREEVRAFLRESLPSDWVGVEAFDENSFEFGREFLKRLAPKNWISPAWPTEYGGLGLGLWEQVVFNEELAYRGAPLINTPAVGYLVVQVEHPVDAARREYALGQRLGYKLLNVLRISQPRAGLIEQPGSGRPTHADDNPVAIEGIF